VLEPGGSGTPEHVSLNCVGKIPMKSRLLAGILSVVVALSLSACNIFDEGDPEKVRIVVTGAEGESFQLVTTTDFDIVTDQDLEDREIYIYTADTSTVTSPYSGRYPLDSRLRFFMKAFNDEALSEAVTVRIYVDSDVRYASSSRLEEGLELEFVYTYR
jgi:hypothetical protein